MQIPDRFPAAPPVHENRVFRRENLVDYTVVFFVAIFVYAWSAPRTVVLEDDGIFILAAYFNGVAHPPGYPLYTLMAHLASLAPIGTVAWRVHLFSGILAAMACICLWQIAQSLLGNRISAYGAALSLAFSQVFWSQAIIAEVYTLNVFLVLLLFLLAVFMQKHRNEHDLKIKFRWFLLCYGLALTNHWPLVILSTPMLVAVLWPQLRSLQRYMPGAFPCFFLGLIPYAWMVVASHVNPEISFYGPINSFYEFWFYLGRKGYADIESSPSAGWIDKLLYIKFVLHQTRDQFGWPGMILGLAGLFYQRRLLPANLCIALILGYLGTTLALALLLGFDFDEFHRNLFRVYPLVAYAVVSLWIGIGMFMVTQLIHKFSAKRPGEGFVASCILLILVGTILIQNASANYRADDFWAKQYAVTILDSFPLNSVLFLYADSDFGPIAYLNRIEGYRQDIVLYHKRGLLLGNRLFQPLYADGRTIKTTIKNFIRSETRPIYYIDDLLHDRGVDFYGHYYKVVKDKEKNYMRVVFLPGLLAYWEYLLDRKIPVDQREQVHRSSSLYAGCKLFTTMEKLADAGAREDERLKKLHGKICTGLLGIYSRIDMILFSDNPDRNRLREFLAEAELHLDEARLKSETALYYYYTGRMYMLDTDHLQARAYLQQAVNAWHHPENPAVKLLRELPE
ncbi:MAG: protein O-mannosyl-transferase family [Gammaproteobacteria bacterium]